MVEQFNVENLTDTEIVMGLIKLIDNAYVDEKGNSSRNDYIIEAKRLLDGGRLGNPHAIKLLEDKINEYEKPEGIESN